MGNFFTNLEIHTEPETTLFPQEVDVILKAVEVAIRRHVETIAKGTLVIMGHKRGEAPYLIAHANIREGAFTYAGMNSDKLAQKSVKELLVADPSYSRYFKNAADRSLKQGIFQVDELLALSLSATHGRFLVAIHTANEAGELQKGFDRLLLCHIATIIAQMGLEDDVLQRNAILTIAQEWKYRNEVNGSGERVIETYVAAQTFVRCPAFEAVETWWAWHEPANNAGELTLFFQ